MTCCGSCGSKKKSDSSEMGWGPEGFKIINDDTFMVAAESQFAGWKTAYGPACGCDGECNSDPSCRWEHTGEAVPDGIRPDNTQMPVPTLDVPMNTVAVLPAPPTIYVVPVTESPACCCIKSVNVQSKPPAAVKNPGFRERTVSVRWNAVTLSWPGTKCEHLFREYVAGEFAKRGEVPGNFKKFDDFDWNEPDDRPGGMFETQQDDMHDAKGRDGSFDDDISINNGATTFQWLQYHEFRSGCRLPQCLNCKLLLWISISPAGVFTVRGKKSCVEADSDGAGEADLPDVRLRQGPLTEEDMKSPWVTLLGLAEWQVPTPEGVFGEFDGTDVGDISVDGGQELSL